MRRAVGPVLAVVAALVVSAGFVAVAAAQQPEIPLTIEKNQFQPSEVKVKANTPFVLVITNKNPKAAEFESKDLRVEKWGPPARPVKCGTGGWSRGPYGFSETSNNRRPGRLLPGRGGFYGRYLRRHASRGLRGRAHPGDRLHLSAEDRRRTSVSLRDAGRPARRAGQHRSRPGRHRPLRAAARSRP